MVDFLRDFIKVLRLSDVRISSSETIDAMKVSSLIGLENKNLLIYWIILLDYFMQIYIS